MTGKAPEDFRRKLLEIGIIGYSEHETLYQIAKRCAGTVGLPMAGGAAVMGAGAGTVTLPIIGTVSGAVAGFLAGLATGTATCTAANIAYRNELKSLAAKQFPF